MDERGKPCDVDPAGIANGWHGGAPECCLGDVVYAACVARSLLGGPCDIAAPVSCADDFVCRGGKCAAP